MSSFRENLIQLMAVQNLALTPLDGLEGAELVEAQENNEGLNQLADAISELHERVLKAAVAAAPKTKTKTATVAAVEEETENAAAAPKKRAPRKAKEPKTAAAEEGEEAPKEPKKRAPRKAKEPTAAAEEGESSGEEAPKEPKKRAPRKAKEPKPAAEEVVEEEPKKKRPANAQAVFAKLVSQAHKGEMTGWDAINLTVSLAKVTEKCQVLLDTAEGKEFVSLKGTETTLAALLQRAQQLLTAVDGKVNLMKLAGLMWSSVGNQIPAQLQQ